MPFSCIKYKKEFLKKNFEQPSHSYSTHFSSGITENHKLNYANVDFEFPLEVQQNMERPSRKYGKRNSVVFPF